MVLPLLCCVHTSAQDDVRRLTEDPLRVLRGVRFAIVLGLKLAPGTAHAMRQYAHMCSLNTGTSLLRLLLFLLLSAGLALAACQLSFAYVALQHFTALLGASMPVVLWVCCACVT